MCSGVVNVIVVPLMAAISLISLIGRSVRENHDIASGGTPGVESYGPDALEAPLSSCHCCTGRGMFHATRSPFQTCALHGKPVGVACQEAPDSSSSSTNCPTANPEALATVTEVAPLAPSAVRLRDVVSSGRGQRCGPRITIGCES